MYTSLLTLFPHTPRFPPINSHTTVMREGVKNIRELGIPFMSSGTSRTSAARPGTASSSTRTRRSRHGTRGLVFAIWGSRNGPAVLFSGTFIILRRSLYIWISHKPCMIFVRANLILTYTTASVLIVLNILHNDRSSLDNSRQLKKSVGQTAKISHQKCADVTRGT
jgi:hypothetical protein